MTKSLFLSGAAAAFLYLIALPSFQTAQAATVTANLSSSADIVTQNQTATLSWVASNATSCIASGGWYGTKAFFGSETVSPTQTTTYSLVCTNGSSQVTNSKTIAVAQDSQPYQLYFSASPKEIDPGEFSVLSWSSSNALSCSASGGWSGTLSLNGSQAVSPSGSTTYTITCTGNYGTAVKSIVLAVNPPFSASNGLQLTVLGRNVSLQQTSFSKTVEAQELDTVEFQIRVKNKSATPLATTIRDTLPDELAYIAGSALLNGTQLPEGIVANNNGISVGTVTAGEEKTVTFRATVLYNTLPKLIRNQTFATTNYDTRINGVDIQIKPRGKVLGAATVVTGPEDTLPIILFLGFFGSIGAYAALFKYRFKNHASKDAVASYIRFRSRRRTLKKREKCADDIKLFL